ncbi:LCP family protein [Amycolatopsis taiwanensis]|nr:LCP family protein [Amycolatopsis taiwanensis]
MSRVVRRVAVGMVSLLVFGVTFLGWAQLHRLISGLSIADVIDPGAAAGTADEQNILLVGLDTRTDAQGNPLPQSILDQLHAGGSGDGGDNTDTMILIHVPAGGGNVVAFSIPRDSYVRLAGGYGMHKINSAYTYAQVAAADSLRARGVGGAQLNVEAAQAGAKNAIQTVQQFTGLTINHFASVNLVGFYDISQAVGGVPVCLNAPVDDSYSGARFPAGPQTVSGAQALAFVRQRHGLPDGDLDRIRRQQAFMASMARTVLSAGTLANPAKLNQLVDALKRSVTIDQGWDVLSFAEQLRNLSAGKIQFQTIPVINVDYQTSDGSAVEVDPAAVKTFIARAIGAAGTVAVQSRAPDVSGGSPLSLQGTAGVTIDVDNGTGADGLAARVLGDLSGHGYTAGTTANVASRTATVVEYASGARADAEKVAEYLGRGVGVTADPGLRSGHLRILLGSEYTGPDSQAAHDGVAGSPPSIETPPSTSNTPPPITAGGQNCVN